jgi:hypothetical protein
MALENLVGEFGIFSGHLVSVKTESTEGRVAGRNGSLRGFPGEDGFPHAFSAKGFFFYIILWCAGINLRPRSRGVSSHLHDHAFAIFSLLLSLLALEFHLLALHGGLLIGGLLHALLLGLRVLLFLLARAFASASSKPR